MKKIIFSIASIVLLGVGGFSYKVYDNYKTREDKINHVLDFKKEAYGAYTMLVSGNYKDAVVLYEKAVAIHDKDTKTLRDYALALSKTGQKDKSLEMYELAYLNSNYKSEEALSNLAKAYYYMQNYPKAIYYYKEAIKKFRPKYRYIQNIILSLEKQDKLDEAMSYFAYIYEKSPDYFKDKKEFARFTKLYTQDIKAKELLPKYEIVDAVDELLALGAEYEEKGLDDKALKTYDKILLQDLNHQEANKKEADLLIRNKDYVHAILNLEALDDESYDSLLTKAKVYHNIKKYDKAIENYEKALEIEQDAFLYKNIASCAFRNKDVNKTIKYLKLLEEKDPRMAYNFEYVTLVSTGKEMNKKEKLMYQAVNIAYDIKDFFTNKQRKQGVK